MKAFARFVSVAVAAAAVATLATSADARPRKRHAVYRAYSQDTIVVRPRAFTDSGVVVPYGSQNFYMQQQVRFTYQPYEAYSPGVLWRPEPAIFR
jgi:hypothetical protein